MAFNFEDIDEYQIEITTHCNASCPQCPRNINGGEVNPYMPLCHLDRDIINKTFSRSHCENLRQIFFCGSYGDPIVHPQFLDILRDFRRKNPTLWLYLHTNGGKHRADWWEELAHILGGYGQVDFGIDGLQDTNHLYRSNVDFDKAINNAHTFIKAGGRANWLFIVFKHNEHQVDQAKTLSSILGFNEIKFRSTGRFLKHDTLEELSTWPVKLKNGKEYELEITTREDYQNASLSNLDNLKAKYPNIKDYFNTTKIQCDALKNDVSKVVITAEGLVLPCNFFTHNLYDARFRDRDILPGANDLSFKDGQNQVEWFINDHGGKDVLNINKHSIEDILEQPFWSALVDSWNCDLANGRIFECAMTCGTELTKVWDQLEMNETSMYVTGNNRGLGLALAEYFNADGCNRTDIGLDITKNIDEIVEESLKYDVFINNAFDGPPDVEWANYAQVNLLMAVYTKWKEVDKEGWIFNIGSSGEKNIVAPDPTFETYRVAKAALSHSSKQCTQAFKNNLVKFKTTLITPDRLDTPLSRSRDSWTGNGIDCQDIINFIEYTMNIQSNTVIEEITLLVNLENK